MQPLAGDIAVLGIGVTGQAVVRYLTSPGILERGSAVWVFDESDGPAARKIARGLEEAGAIVELGAKELTRDVDLVVASPGIPPSSALIGSARSRSPRVISEIEFAHLRSISPWIAVTGTNGKTTVTSLIAHLLREAGSPVECVGNIGDPAIEVVEASGPSTVIVAEVSSFQLALTETFRPRVGVLLNITPDHVDWHGSYEAYAADKARVFANMGPGDTAVIDADDPGSAACIGYVESRGVDVARVSRVGLPSRGAGLVSGVLTLDLRSGTHALLNAEELRIRGDHNVSNALAAASAVAALGIPPEVIASGLRSFRPIAHRLEPVGVVDGVEYVNDSKATNPGATRMALTAYVDRSVVLLLGGRNKGSDFAELIPDVSGCCSIVTFGEAGEEIAEALGGTSSAVVRRGTFAEALDTARGIAQPGDVVLLSPACASFDEFTGYAARGEALRAWVDSLAGASRS